MAKAYVAIGDLSGAGGVIRQAREILQRRPDLGTLASDIMRYLLTSPALSYSVVFASEAGLFLVSACMAIWVHRAPARNVMRHDTPGDMRAAAVAGGARS